MLEDPYSNKDIFCMKSFANIILLYKNIQVIKQSNKEKVAGIPQQREPDCGPRKLENIRIVKIHNHKIKSNTRQAGQDYDTYYI